MPIVSDPLPLARVNLCSPYVGDMGGLSDVSLVLSRQQVAVLYSVCDLLACVVFLFGICIMTSSEEDDIRSAAASIITSDQYSVRARGGSRGRGVWGAHIKPVHRCASRKYRRTPHVSS